MIFTNTIALTDASNLPPVIALYAVFDGETLLYIGSTTGLRRRIMGHLASEKFKPEFILKWNEYAEANALQQLAIDEPLAIKTMGPSMNKTTRCGRKVRNSWPHCGRKARERSTLHQVTYDLLWAKIEASISKLYVLDQACAATGLSFSWLTQFTSDVGGSPAVDRMEALYEYLSGKKLEINNV